jgi:hypothetical protein
MGKSRYLVLSLHFPWIPGPASLHSIPGVFLSVPVALEVSAISLPAQPWKATLLTCPFPLCELRGRVPEGRAPYVGLATPGKSSNFCS